MQPHPDTLRHRARVKELMGHIVLVLQERAEMHDLSKTQSPEVEAFNAATDKLAGLEYGSEEYKAALAELGPALQHHYACNEHHPEHWPNGVFDMSLVDLVEMLCDWKAASERHATGSMSASLEYNAKRFGIDPQLARVLENTARAQEW